MRKFDYSFLKNDNLPYELLNLTNYIHEVKKEEEEKKTLNPMLFNKMITIAKVQSVKGSNAIEGIVTTDKRIKALMDQKTEPLNHNEKEIAGYRDALDLVHTNYQALSFDEKDILNLHNIMLTQSGSPFRGHYKTEDNAIIEIDHHGNRTVRFRPMSAEETPEAMSQLVLAYMDARQDSEINQLILIPCVILDFLCIHPFDDGNGRMSRLLFLLLMYKTNYDVGKYISFEQQINLNKESYYEALRLSSLLWEDNKNDYSFFIKNFIITLYKCYLELEKRLATVGLKKIKKEERIKMVLLNSLLPMSKQEILDIVPDISGSTVERVLADMLKDGQIEKYGSFKDARYKRKR
jgi:Fic family protein